MLARGINAVLLMVGERNGRYSLSCNADLTHDVVAGARAMGACVVVGLVNRKLPFMTGEAEVGPREPEAPLHDGRGRSR
jgi:hypothetical protein